MEGQISSPAVLGHQPAVSEEEFDLQVCCTSTNTEILDLGRDVEVEVEPHS